MLASALCLIICPDSVSAGGAAKRRPCAGKIARRGKLQGFLRVMAHTARTALLSGWLSVLLVCNFQGTARGDSEPLTVLPKIAFGEYPYFEEFSKNFLRSRRMRSLRLMTARWLTPIL